MSILFAATYPDRTAALVLLSGYAAQDVGARLSVGLDGGARTSVRSSAHSASSAPASRLLEAVRQLGQFTYAEADSYPPDAPVRSEPRRRSTALHRDARGRATSGMSCRASGCRLCSSTAPRTAERPDRGRPVDGVERIPMERLVELPGIGHLAFGAGGRISDEVRALRTGRVGGRRLGGGRARPRAGDRPLHGHRRLDRERAAALGDRGWWELLERHHELVRRQLLLFRGKEVDTAGDGFFARFDGPARAIRCACAIAESVRRARSRGPCRPAHGRVRGPGRQGRRHRGPHRRTRLRRRRGRVRSSSRARSRISSAGSGIVFEDRGSRELKGIPGEWRLFAVHSPGT